MGSYDDDIKKALKSADNMRGGSPNNVLWLIVQSLQWLGGLALAANNKLDKLLSKPSGGNCTCNTDEIVIQLTKLNQTIVQIETRLDTIETKLKPVVDRSSARVVARGPVSER